MNHSILKLLLPLLLTAACTSSGKKNTDAPKELAVIAYYSGNADGVEGFPVEKLTHIIFSFGHLKGNKLFINNAGDTATIQKLVSMKNRNPALKIILSLGGWGGCETCSPVFATATGRTEFAGSVKELMEYFKTDGLDLDWEYPAIEGYPGHAYQKEDKSNFTALVQSLRDTLGTKYEISFAAGGFDSFLEQSIEWNKIMPLLDKVNLMSYDLVSGFSRVTGHHTPLYSTKEQKQSADNAIRYLDSIGVPLNKLIIGAAFYARVWDSVANINQGLYQAGVFKSFIGFSQFQEKLSTDSGYIFYRDEGAKASYAYNASKNLFATFDDSLSISDKTKYVKDKGLGGIMFWELSLDKKTNGLVDVIDRVKKGE
jgi:chitinase